MFSCGCRLLLVTCCLCGFGWGVGLAVGHAGDVDGYDLATIAVPKCPWDRMRRPVIWPEATLLGRLSCRSCPFIPMAPRSRGVD